ncbi:MAG: PKD domain-containing protein [Bacteroidetes bacterium]|nr:PKD domain-containing protein [Bacteroidota bacterium]
MQGEYFFDADPGVKNGFAYSNSPADSIYDTLFISTAGLNSCFHTIFFRAKDSNNIWSLYEGGSFYLSDTVLQTNTSSYFLAAGEYFYDADPGIGKGIPLPAFSPADSILLTDSLPTAPLTAGMHHLFLRVRDSMNVWSLYEGQAFVICNFIPVADFSADTVCQNSPMSFTDLSSNLDTTANYTYSWDFNSDGITDDTTKGNTTHIFSTPGTHTVTLIVNNTSGCIDTVKKVVLVDSLPIVTLVLPVDTLCKLDTLVLSGGNPAGGIYSGPGVYSGIFYTDSTSTGNKIITYTYTNSDSCTASATAIIHVNPCTGINELNVSGFGFQVYPNPSGGIFSIQCSMFKDVQIKISDAIGKIILEKKLNSEKEIVNMSEVPAGIYFLKLFSEGKVLGTGKLIITD